MILYYLHVPKDSFMRIEPLTSSSVHIGPIDNWDPKNKAPTAMSYTRTTVDLEYRTKTILSIFSQKNINNSSSSNNNNNNNSNNDNF